MSEGRRIRQSFRPTTLELHEKDWRTSVWRRVEEVEGPRYRNLYMEGERGELFSQSEAK